MNILPNVENKTPGVENPVENVDQPTPSLGKSPEETNREIVAKEEERQAKIKEYQQKIRETDANPERIEKAASAKERLTKLGYTPEELEALKANFSGKTSDESYNEFQKESFKAALKVLDEYQNDPKNESDVNLVGQLKNRINQAVKAAGTSRLAIKAFPILMDDYLDKAEDIKDSRYKSVKFYKGIQDDLALSVLDAQKEGDIAQMAKASQYKKSKNVSILKSIANILSSSISQEGAKPENPLVSDKTPEELYKESVKK